MLLGEVAAASAADKGNKRAFAAHLDAKRVAFLPQIREFVARAAKAMPSTGSGAASTTGAASKLASALPTPAIVDARSPGRFAGTDPEPRAHLQSGHMPGTFNTPFGQFTYVDAAGVARFKAPAELRKVFAAAGTSLDVAGPDHPFVATCGSGMTAATVYLGLHVCGQRNIALYDGSWTEYADPALKNPIVKSS